MRIGIDGRLLRYQRAGISAYILGLLFGLTEVVSREQIVVLTARRGSLMPAQSESGFSTVGCITPPHNLLERWSLAIEVALTKLDLLHSPDFITPARIMDRSRRVITVHDLAFLRYPEILTTDSRRYYGQIFRAVKEADAIISVSDHTKRDLIELTDAEEERVVVVPEASSPVFRPIEDRRAVDETLDRLDIRKPYFLFVGTIEPRKNLVNLTRAYGEFLNQHKRPATAPELILAGARGWLYDEVFESIDQLGIASRVRHIIRPSEADLVGLMNGAIALVMPSRYEGFGLPVLEAMSCGTPVCASNVSALPELVGDAGLLVHPDDIEGWSAALTRLHEDEILRRDLGQKGLRRAAGFSWKNAARETLDLYRKILA